MKNSKFHKDLIIIKDKYRNMVTTNHAMENIIIDGAWLTLHNLVNNIDEFSDDRTEMLIILNVLSSNITSLFEEIELWSGHEVWYNDLRKKWFFDVNEELITTISADWTPEFSIINRLLRDSVQIHNELVDGYINSRGFQK